MFYRNKLIDTIFNYIVELCPHYNVYVKLLQYKQTLKLKKIQKHSFIKNLHGEINIILDIENENDKVEIVNLYNNNITITKINNLKPLNSKEFKNVFNDLILSFMNENNHIEKLFKFGILSLEKMENRYTLKKSCDFGCESYFLKDNFIDEIFII